MRAASNFPTAYVMNSFADLCFTTYLLLLSPGPHLGDGQSAGTSRWHSSHGCHHRHNINSINTQHCSSAIFSVFTTPSVYLAGAPTLGCTRQIARPAPRTVHDTDMDRELNRQQIICMYFIVSFLTSNNQQDSILAVYTFGPLLRYLTSNVSGSKASFSYIESCLASTSLICLSFIHQPWFTEILQLMIPWRWFLQTTNAPPPLTSSRSQSPWRAAAPGGRRRWPGWTRAPWRTRPSRRALFLANIFCLYRSQVIVHVCSNVVIYVDISI